MSDNDKDQQPSADSATVSANASSESANSAQNAPDQAPADKTADKLLTNTDNEPNKSASATRSTPRTPASKPVKRGNKLRWFILLLLLAVAGAGGYGWLLLQQQLQQMNAELEFQKNKLDGAHNKATQAEADLIKQQELNDNFKTLLEQQAQSLADFDLAQQTLLQNSQNVFDITHRNQRQWLLAEVSYLLSIANQRLLIARDIETATMALKAANHRLHDLADPSLLKARKQIADEIAALNQIQRPDINGMALALDNIVKQIGLLPFKTAEQQLRDRNQQTEAIDIGSLDQGNVLAPLWERAKGLISIKKHNRDIQKAETTLDRTEIDRQLRYRLEAARLALIDKNSQVFNHEMSACLLLLTDYYDQNDNRVSQLLDEVSPYSTLNLLPDLPDITASWTMLQRAIAIADANASLKPANKGNIK